MLNQEQRQQLLDFLAVKGSDSVLMDAYENAQREFDHAIITLTNLTHADRSARIKAKAALGAAQPTAPIADPVPTVNYAPLVAVLPKKLGATGSSCVAGLKRAASPQSLEVIAKQAGVSVSAAKPQVALAISRGLIKQVHDNLFEAVK